MIVISVAHSKTSPGAGNRNYGLSEYQLSQTMTKACADFLNGNLLEAQILDVGAMPYKKYINEKIRYINKSKPELALEIHLDGGSKDALHHSCFYRNSDDSAKRVSNLILHQLKDLFEPLGWGHVNPIGLPAKGYGNYALVLDTKYPTLIVEPLFITNDVHAKVLTDEDYLAEIGKEIAKGILQWHSEKKNSLLH